jgi:hypothetical protein
VAKAVGSNEFADDERASVHTAVEERDEDFAEAFEEGDFFELAEFAKARNIEYQTEEDLIDYIESKLQLECGIGKTGARGVFVVNKKPGASYKFKRGARSSTALVRTEDRHDGDLNREEFEQRVGGSTALLARASASQLGTPCVRGDGADVLQSVESVSEQPFLGITLALYDQSDVLLMDCCGVAAVVGFGMCHDVYMLPLRNHSCVRGTLIVVVRGCPEIKISSWMLRRRHLPQHHHHRREGRYLHWRLPRCLRLGRRQLRLELRVRHRMGATQKLKA